MASRRKAVLKMPPSKGKQACSIKRLSHQKAPVTWATALGRATSVKRRVFRHSSQFIPPSPFRRPLCLFLFRCRTVKFSHGFRCSGRGGDSRPAIVVYKLFFQAVCELFFFCLHGHRGWVMFRVEWKRGKFFHVESTFRPYCSYP